MTGIALNGKVVDLGQLQGELVAAGVDITGLGISGGDLITYNDEGQPADLPEGAAAVVVAHTPVIPSDPIAEADIAAFTAISSATTLDQVKAAILTWMASRPGVVVPE